MSAACPDRLDHRARAFRAVLRGQERIGRVGKGQFGPRPFQQGLGDEQAQPHAFIARPLRRPRRSARRARTNGSPIRPITLGGKPSPSSMIRTVMRPVGPFAPRSRPCERAKSTAFCTRLRRPWMISGRRRIVGCGPLPSGRGKGETPPACPAPDAARRPRAARRPSGACRRCRSSFPARPMSRRISRQRSAWSRISRASSCKLGLVLQFVASVRR